MKQKTFENWIKGMDSWDFPMDGFFFIAFKDHFFLYSKSNSKSLYMGQMKLIISWYKLIAQAFKHQDLENVLYKGSSCTILKRRPFFFFLILKEKKSGLFLAIDLSKTIKINKYKV